jgi:hypothetical protein
VRSVDKRLNIANFVMSTHVIIKNVKIISWDIPWIAWMRNNSDIMVR